MRIRFLQPGSAAETASRVDLAGWFTCNSSEKQVFFENEFTAEKDSEFGLIGIHLNKLLTDNESYEEIFKKTEHEKINSI